MGSTIFHTEMPHGYTLIHPVREEPIVVSRNLHFLVRMSGRKVKTSSPSFRYLFVGTTIKQVGLILTVIDHLVQGLMNIGNMKSFQVVIAIKAQCAFT